MFNLVKHSFQFLTKKFIHLELEEAYQKIKDKLEEKKSNIINEWPEKSIQVLKGRYGPYITDGKKNAKIPKDKETF